MYKYVVTKNQEVAGEKNRYNFTLYRSIRHGRL